MNVATIKLLCWLSSLAMATTLVLGALRFIFDIERHKTPVTREYVTEVLQEELTITVDVREGLDYKNHVRPTFIDMNWTGKPKPKPVEAGPVAEVGPTEPVKTPMADVLRIWYLQEDDTDPGGSQAMVVFVDSNQEGVVLQVGDILPPPHDVAVVHGIRSEGIEFAFSDDRENELVALASLEEELIVSVDDGNLRMPSRYGIPAGQRRKRPENTEELARNNYLLGDLDRAEFERDYQRILTEDVRLRTHYDEDGNRAGIEVQSVKEDSIAKRHGAQDGDVIISINGHKVHSQAEALAFVKENGDKYSVWNVVIMRLGRQETIVINSDDH